jgi:hypothetical protein
MRLKDESRPDLERNKYFPNEFIGQQEAGIVNSFDQMMMTAGVCRGGGSVYLHTWTGKVY